MNYCGIDLASHTSAICIISSKGKVLKEVEVPTEYSGLKQDFYGFSGLRCVMRAGPLAEWVASRLEEIEVDFVIIRFNLLSVLTAYQY